MGWLAAKAALCQGCCWWALAKRCVHRVWVAALSSGTVLQLWAASIDRDGALCAVPRQTRGHAVGATKVWALQMDLDVVSVPPSAIAVCSPYPSPMCS